MNYLAHAYFSFNHPQVLVGNMISDFVKGKQQYHFLNDIQKGIQLHRAIDNFTDTHKVISKAKELFKPQIGLYSGAFVDIAFDYFLANDATVFFTNEHLMDFTQNVYQTLQTHQQDLPENFKAILQHMQQHNWLYNYKQPIGIEKSFAGLTRRAKYINPLHKSFEVFTNNISILQEYYDEFIVDLKQFSDDAFVQLFSK